MNNNPKTSDFLKRINKILNHISSEKGNFLSIEKAKELEELLAIASTELTEIGKDINIIRKEISKFNNKKNENGSDLLNNITKLKLIKG